MPRARNIKPGCFKNEDLVSPPPLTRILFIGLWTLADRDGRLEDRPMRVKLEILPGDNCNVDAMLNELASKGFIVRYEAGGQKCIQVVNFAKHQNPHPGKYPPTCHHPRARPQRPTCRPWNGVTRPWKGVTRPWKGTCKPG